MWHNYTADLVLRAPIESAHIAPYLFAGGGAILEDSSEFLGRAGAGVEIRPTANFGIFADWVYNFPGGGGGDDDVEDYQMVRMGLKFGLLITFRLLETEGRGRCSGVPAALFC